jgi:hypothetical protein
MKKIFLAACLSLFPLASTAGAADIAYGESVDIHINQFDEIGAVYAHGIVLEVGEKKCEVLVTEITNAQLNKADPAQELTVGKKARVYCSLLSALN